MNLKFLLVAIIISIVALYTVHNNSLVTDAALVGGFGPTHPPQQEELAIFDSVSQNFLSNANLTGSQHSIVINSVRTQVVAGLNFLFEVSVGQDKYHVKVYRDLQGNISLTDFEKI